MSEYRELKVGDPAPDFTLADQNGRLISLRDYRNRKAVVLYFYPKDFTSGCTLEACAFRDTYDTFQAAGAEIIGVSSDPVESHKQFSDSYQLPFILLSDTESALRKLYGVKPSLKLIPGRVTFVIDQYGIVRNIFSSLANAGQHTLESLTVIRDIR